VRLLKGKDRVRRNRRKQRPQSCGRIGWIHQHEASDNGVEFLLTSKIVEICRKEVDICQTGRFSSLPSLGDCEFAAIDPNDFSSCTHQLACGEAHIADAAADVEHAHSL